MQYVTLRDFLGTESLGDPKPTIYLVCFTVICHKFALLEEKVVWKGRLIFVQ